jgi:toxin ParE1/3/4
MKALHVQRRALRDMMDARAYYQHEAPHMGPEFARRLDEALVHLQSHPGTGSPRYGLELGITGLRSWAMSQFPYVIFYRNLSTRITVLRVLHQASQIPIHLQR